MSRAIKRNQNNFKREGAPSPFYEPQQKQRKTQKQKRKERLKKREEARAAASSGTNAILHRRDKAKAKKAPRKAMARPRAAAETRLVGSAQKTEAEDAASACSSFSERASDDADQAALCEGFGGRAVEREAGGDAPRATSLQHWDTAERADSSVPQGHVRLEISEPENALQYGTPVLIGIQRPQEPERHQDQGLEQALTASIAHFTQGIERLGSFLTEAAKSPVHMAESYRAFVVQQGADSFVVGGQEISRDEVVRETESLIRRLRA